MTIASECVAACELGLAYAAICVVDNLANGVGERELTMEEFEAGRAANREARGGAALGRLVPALAMSLAVDGRAARRRASSACGPRAAASPSSGRGGAAGRATR